MSDADLPWMKFYPGDFMGSGKVQMMSPAERGIYISLLCHEWQEGPLPDDPTRLARVAGATPTEMEEAWPAVRPCFSVDDSGRLYHERLESERQDAVERMERRRKMSEAGRKGAAKRWADRDGGSPPIDEGGDDVSTTRGSNASEAQRDYSTDGDKPTTEGENNTPPSGEEESQSLGNWTTEYVPIITEALWMDSDPPEKSPEGWSLAAELRAIKSWRSDGRRDQEIQAFLLGAAILRDREELGGVEQDEGITCARLRYDSPYDVVDQWSRFPHAYHKFEGSTVGRYELDDARENGRSGGLSRATA